MFHERKHLLADISRRKHCHDRKNNLLQVGECANRDWNREKKLTYRLNVVAAAYKWVGGGEGRYLYTPALCQKSMRDSDDANLFFKMLLFCRSIRSSCISGGQSLGLTLNGSDINKISWESFESS